jgi:hypothetical protein
MEMKKESNESDFLRCKESLVHSIEALGGTINGDTSKDVEQIAKLIMQSMTGTWRFFHTPEHIFEVGGNDDPIEIISALFHDMVYVQVDYGININLSVYLTPFIREHNEQLFIRPECANMDHSLFHLLLIIFGFKPGDTLSPYNGQNEFLSALIAVQCLQNFLPPSILAEIAACIEATIPFRKLKEGKSPYDFLKLRLLESNQIFGFKWTEEAIDEILIRCVRMANRDIENFGNENPVRFLDNTWNLMPETNHDLKTTTSYSIAGYRTSMTKMLNFLNSLVPEQIFHQHKSEPSTERLHNLFENTRKNLRIAKLYLESKILTIGILEALSFRIGRNTPLSTLIGEIPVQGMIIPTLDHFLPQIPRPFVPDDPLEEIVLDVLTYGRQMDTTYDLKNSPITAFLVRAIGFQKMEEMYESLKDFYEEKIGPEDFLDSCDEFVLNSVIEGVIKIFEQRTIYLRKIKKEK